MTFRGSLWQVSVNGKDPHPLLPAWHAPPAECCGRWTPDGKYFVFQSQDNIWGLAEKANLFGKANSQPFQLTSGPMGFFSPLFSKDGKKLFVVGALARGELSRYDMKSAAFVPFLSGISADSPSFSKDGQWVAYVSFPEGTLWRSKADGSQRVQLTYPPLSVRLPSWSPEGRQIIFYGFLAGEKAKVYTVSADGGTPRAMMPVNNTTLPGRPMEQRLPSAVLRLIPTLSSGSSTLARIKFRPCPTQRVFSHLVGRLTDAISSPCLSIPAALCFSILLPKSGRKSRK
jgi:Tol biopolymer transport system component